MRYDLKVRAAIDYIDLYPVRASFEKGQDKNLTHFFTPLNFPVGTLFNGVNTRYNAPCAITGFTSCICQNPPDLASQVYPATFFLAHFYPQAHFLWSPQSA